MKHAFLLCILLPLMVVGCTQQQLSEALQTAEQNKTQAQATLKATTQMVANAEANVSNLPDSPEKQAALKQIARLKEIAARVQEASDKSDAIIEAVKKGDLSAPEVQALIAALPPPVGTYIGLAGAIAAAVVAGLKAKAKHEEAAEASEDLAASRDELDQVKAALGDVVEAVEKLKETSPTSAEQFKAIAKDSFSLTTKQLVTSLK